VGVPSENHFNRIKNQLNEDLAKLIRKFMLIGERHEIRDQLRNKNIKNELSLYPFCLIIKNILINSKN